MLRYLFASLLFSTQIFAQDPKATEVWKPEPEIVTPGKTNTDPPSDAIVLFDGKSSSAWQHDNGDKVKWIVSDNALIVTPKSGGIKTVQKFGSCQLHIEWRTPAKPEGEGQARGNSGVFMMGRYELQIMDSYGNKTFANGQAGSMYKQYAPLVNACKGPGEWQSFDIIFIAPVFNDKAKLVQPARITVLQNGVLIQNNVAILGSVTNSGMPTYTAHDAKESISLQDHGNPTAFRNIWIREL